MTKLLLLICSVLTCTALAVAAISTAERRAIIEAAAREVRNRATVQKSVAKQSGPVASLNAFKRASPETLREGNSRLMFEDMVRHAETKLFERERQTNRQTSAEAKAEELASELLHQPGSKLQSDELARLFFLSGCQEVLEEDENMPTNCLEDPALRRYRTRTGVCNNLQNPLFGAANKPFRRLIDAQYEDGVSQLRGTMQGQQTGLFHHGPFGSPNPSARLVSQTVVRDRLDEQDGISHLTTIWGAFIDHEFAATPAFADCPANCNTDVERCVPIPIPQGDPAFGEQLECHPFARSIPACEGPRAGVVPSRQQINEITAFVDGSEIYGTTEVIVNAVREPGTARLRVGPNIPSLDGGPSLPITCQPGQECLVPCPDTQNCFLAGDGRVNENTVLIVIHTIWVREHNRIADQLSQMNPQWSPDKVFSVAKIIVGAEMQKIIYKDYLANVILGQNVFNQLIQSYEDSGRYTPQIDPAVPNSFAAAAFRFGHSQVRPFFDRLDENYQNISAGPLSLVDAFFDPESYEESGGTDPLLRGLLSTQARKVDEFVNSFLTTRLFDKGNGGMDLVTLNIQRARDHGLPPYMTWKKWAQRECNVSSNFRSDLTEVRLLQLYGTLETVDLFVGALAEENLPGALVGATIACIFARTFGPIRNADRFYYENVDGEDAFFTAAQRDQIEKTSLSRVICDTADNIQTIQRDAFRVANSDQDRVPCTELPQVDLSVFSTIDSEDRTANKQLISVLESYIKRIRNEDSNTNEQHHTNQQYSSNEDNDANLMSELETALNELDEQ